MYWVGLDDVDIHAPSDHARRYTGRRYLAASHSCDYVHSVGDREGKGSVGALSGWDEYVLFFALVLTLSFSMSESYCFPFLHSISSSLRYISLEMV